MSSPIRRNPITRRLCRNPITRRLMRCCGAPTAPWYILATPCGTGTPTGGPCAPAPRPFVWVCVDAKLSDTGQTIRQALGPSAGCVTFLFNGWCYSVCYLPDGDSGLTTRDPPRIPGSLPVIECVDVLQVVARRPYNSATPGSNPADCGTPACPTGINYVQATRCDKEPLTPPVYVCAGQVRRTIVANPPSIGACICVQPGTGVDSSQIPPGARVYNAVAYPEDNPGPVIDPATLLATWEKCCQCLPQCSSVPLQGNPARVCCCGNPVTLSTYVMDYSFIRRTPDGNGGTLIQTVSGRAAPSSPPPAGFVYLWQFRTNGALIQDGDGTPPFTEPLCGFPVGPFPPPAFFDSVGEGVTPPANLPQYSVTSLLTGLNLEPGPNNQGILLGTANASCSSIAIEVRGTLTNPDIGQSLEVRINVNLSINVPPTPGCDGCGSFKPLITEDAVAQTDDPALLLP